jgi:hypothetical protein
MFLEVLHYVDPSPSGVRHDMLGYFSPCCRALMYSGILTLKFSLKIKEELQG